MSDVSTLQVLLVLLAMEATELSEGQACKTLDVDRVTLRTIRDDAISKGVALAERARTVT